MSTDLAAFVAARLDEDDARVPLLAHTTRMWRELNAKRAILAVHQSYRCGEPGGEVLRCFVCASGQGYRSGAAVHELSPCPTLRAMASVWNNHPDYNQEWKPVTDGT